LDLKRIDALILSTTLEPDVLIVGAGPAGSTLGGLLARDGVDAVVLDRADFPRPKPCGESVNPGAVAALRRLGLLDGVLAQSPAAIRYWTVRAEGRLAAPGRYEPGGESGLGIARSVLDRVLVDQARGRGACVREGCTVVSVQRGPGGRFRLDVRTRGRITTLRPRILVGADGLRSVVARRLGLVRRTPHVRKVSLTCHVSGAGPDRQGGSIRQTSSMTVGIAPISSTEHLWNVTIVLRGGLVERRSARDSVPLVRAALAESGLAWTSGVPQIVAGPWASGPFDWPSRWTVAPNVLLAGDAAGYFDPFTGQGIHQALRSAELAAPRIAELLERPDDDGPLRRYARSLRREVRPVRLFQRIVEKVMDGKRSRPVAVRGLKALPWYADRVVRVAGDAAPVRTLAMIDLRPSRAIEANG